MRDIRLCDNCKKEYTAEICIESGLGIEVQSFYDPYIPEQEKLLQDYLHLIDRVPGGRSLHAPFWELNSGTKMLGIRAETMNMFQFAYERAKRLGCTEVIVHNGYIPGTSPEPRWAERSAVFWREFLEGKDGVTFCIENQFEQDWTVLTAVVDAVNDPRLKICLDIGHAHANSDHSPEEWIASLGERIGYYHLHNNHGKRNIKGHNNDEHLSLTEGTINMSAVLALAEQFTPDAVWAIEANPASFAQCIAFLKKIGYVK